MSLPMFEFACKNDRELTDTHTHTVQINQIKINAKHFCRSALSFLEYKPTTTKTVLFCLDCVENLVDLLFLFLSLCIFVHVFIVFHIHTHTQLIGFGFSKFLSFACTVTSNLCTNIYNSFIAQKFNPILYCMTLNAIEKKYAQIK